MSAPENMPKNLPKNQPEKRPNHLAIGLALTYSAYFMFHGLYLPYFPLWLAYEHLSEQQIGILLALPMVMRVLTSGYMVELADRFDDRAKVLSAFYWISAILFCLYAFSKGYWVIFAITIAFNLFWIPSLPVIDAIALSSVRRFSLDYGKVRIWGSIAFVVANLAGGVVLAQYAANSILYVMMGLIVLGAGISFLIPRFGRARPKGQDADDAITQWTLMKDRRFLLFIVAAGLIQASHAMMYAFGSIYWESLGINGNMIGGLWALGVLVEIILFQVSSAVLRRFSTWQFMGLAGIAGIVRWAMMCFDIGLAGFFVAQALHGITFGATHIATMHFLKDAVPESRLSAAQASGFVVGGVFMALAMVASGPLYAGFGRYGFGVMAVLCVLALVCLIIAKGIQPQSSAEGGETVDPS